MLHPFRLFILGFLFYILYKLLTGGSEKLAGRFDGDRSMPPPEDVLVEDPECHTLIPKKQAVVADINGMNHYFCSERCRDGFAAKVMAATMEHE